MRLNYLYLKDFRGSGEYMFTPSGKNTNVYGYNATGKTTLFDAYTWVLSGKDSQNRTDFEIKPLDNTGNTSAREAYVLSGIELKKKDVTLGKRYQEVWSKHRGQIKKTFTGKHKVVYELNGNVVTKAQYDEFIEFLGGDEYLKVMSNPFYLNSIHWTDRKRFLTGIFGDVSHEEIVELDNKYKEIPLLLGNLTREMRKEQLRTDMTKLTREVDKLDNELQGMQESLTEPGEYIDPAPIQEKLTVKMEELAQLQAGGEISTYNQNLIDIDARIAEINQEIEKDKKSGREHIDKQSTYVFEHYKELRQKMFELEQEHNGYLELIDSNKDKLNVLRQQWVEEAEQLDALGIVPKNCPTCGAIIDQQLWIALHGERNEKRKIEISNRLEALERSANNRLSQIEYSNAKCYDLRGEMYKVFMSAAELQHIKLPPEHEPTTEQKQKLAELLAERAKFKDLKEGISEDDTHIKAVETLKAEVEDIRRRLDDANQWLARKEASAETKAKIDAKSIIRKRMVAEYEKFFADSELLDEYNKAHAQLLSERINPKLEMVTIKFIDDNADLCCVTTMGGVPWPDLNHGGQLSAGLDIIMAMQDELGEGKEILPIWIDNAESYCHIPDMPNQQIELIVSEKDLELRVETYEPIVS
ncbi:MAG: hypothetical protein SVY53_12035 [Chloroflexota bacterium]|nr:hypothetical protein [Chloroflexota bacterium]